MHVKYKGNTDFTAVHLSSDVFSCEFKEENE